MTAARVGGAVAALIGLLGGCGSTCPRFDDGNWRELSTPNFRLRTDLDDREARRTLEELESVRAALLTSFGAEPGINTGQVAVVALDEGWGAAAGPMLNGVYGQALFTPHIAIRAGSGLVGQPLVKHELVHQLSGALRPREPAWLAEGLAMYFQTLEISAESRLVTVGRPEAPVVSLLHHQGFMSVGQLRAGTAVHDSRSGFYPSAWLVVHYLMNHRRGELRAYQNTLQPSASDQASDNDRESQAWQAAFGDLTSAQLDRQLRAYVDGGKYYVYRFSFAPPRPRITGARTLTPADAHATRALIYASMKQVATSSNDVMSRSGPELETCARQELDEVFRHDPDHTMALAVKAWELGDRLELSQVQSSANKNAGDWMAWWLLASTLQAHRVDDDRLAQAAQRARELAAGNRAIALPETEAP